MMLIEKMKVQISFICFKIAIVDAKYYQDDSELLITTLWVLFFTMCAVFGPAIIYFVYSVITDPITPSLITELISAIRAKSIGFLGNDKQKKTKKKSAAK